MAKTILLHCGQMADLAQQICDSYENIELGNISWQRFEDEFPYLMVEDVSTLRGRHVAFLACFDSPGTVFEQLAIMQAVPRYGARSFRIVLPYFPTATMERVAREGEVATAKTLARLLSVTPLSRSGPVEIVVFDIHALQERFYFSDAVIPILETAVPLIKRRLKQLPKEPKVVIAFPDEGAWKRFGKLFDVFEQILCHKVRLKGKKRVVTLKEGCPKGHHVVIVDDLVKTGGTLLQCAKMLRSEGAALVSAYVTHGVFPQESWRRFLNGEVDNLWITDSCPAIAREVSAQKPFEVLSLAGIIGKYLSQPD